MLIQLTLLKPDEPFAVSHDYNPKELELEFVDLKYLDAVHMSGTVEKGAETLSFRGRVKSDIQHLCGRCLKLVPDKVDKPFQFYYETKNETVIDATNDIRELLIIDYPISYICSEQCKGLCPQCGANLNETSCQCKAQPEPPKKKSLSGLKEAWEKKYGGTK